MNNNNINSTDNIQVGGVSTAALAALSVTDAKIAGITSAGKVNGTALTNLPGTPSGAGLMPQANIPKLTSSGNGVDGSGIVSGLASVPSGAGIIPVANVGGLLGAWVSKTPDGTVYQAATDGFVTCYITTNGASLIQIDAYTDSSNPPTTKRQSFQTQGATVGGGSICMPVRKNDYYKVQTNGGGVMYFIPLGS